MRISGMSSYSIECLLCDVQYKPDVELYAVNNNLVSPVTAL